MPLPQSLRRVGGAVALGVCACGSGSGGAQRSAAVPALATVRVAEPEGRPHDAPRRPARAAETTEDVPLPSFEMPSGLTEDGRDQYLALLGVMLAIVGELADADLHAGLDCEPLLDVCRLRYQTLSGSLLHVVQELHGPWFDCHGLDPIDRRTFLESSTRFKNWVVFRIRRIDQRVESSIKSQQWGAQAERLWRAMGVESALDG